MAHRYGDRVKDTTTTTGTGNITVSGSAPSGFRTLSAVLTGDGDTGDFVIVGGGEWEVVTLTRVSANEYSRGTPFASSNSGAAVNFSAGTKDVFLTLPADLFDDSAYGAGWNGSRKRPTQDALHDFLESILHPGVIADGWVAFGAEPGDSTTLANQTSANLMIFKRVWNPKAITISDMGVYVGTLVSGGAVGCGIYADDAATNLPTGSPLAATGELDASSTGLKTVDITGDDVLIPRGYCWRCVWHKSATMRMVGYNSNNVGRQSVFGGYTNAADVLGNQFVGRMLTASNAFDTSSWPAISALTLSKHLSNGPDTVVIVNTVS